MHGQHDVRNLNLGDSFGPLEAASGHRRRDIVINQAGLLDAFQGLINNTPLPAGQRNRNQIAGSLLYFTHLISEVLCIRHIRSHIQSHFLGGLIMPDNLLMLEHGWGRGWYRMQHPFTTQHIITNGLLYHPHNALSLHDIEEIYSIIIIDMVDPPTYSLVSTLFQPNVNLNVLQVNALNLYYDTHLTHVRFRNGNDALTLFVRSHDLYIVGFQVNDGTAYLLYHDLDLFLEPIFPVGDFVLVLGGLPLHYLQREYMIEVDRINFPYDLMNRARRLLELHGQHDVRNLNLGDSYGSLEADSGHMRRDIVINQVGLLETFQGLINNTPFPAGQRNRDRIAGFQVNGGTAYLLHHDLDLFLKPMLPVGDFVVVLSGLPLHYFQREWMKEVDRDNLPLDLMNRARGSIGMHGQHDVQNLNLGDLYGSLEAASGHRRSDIVISQAGLLEGFQKLINNFHLRAGQRKQGLDLWVPSLLHSAYIRGFAY
ncbi:hypothetical protein POM88_000955 [Heracleum sosnowskyi]|uniref:Uncharacterized protein n=1 Tax=Heracleum sosnowskyi TaxID=360622 RepID=A0AAD8JF79_9APIA|nr:hypothetical protein POM88_000955 [Heracleum sosnowskyi]